MKDNESFVWEKMTTYSVKTVSIHEAKTNFSKLVKRAEAGETIYIGAYGKPTVAIISSDTIPKKKPVINAFGCMKGEMKLKEGWDDPWTDEEIEEMFHNMQGLEDFIKK